MLKVTVAVSFRSGRHWHGRCRVLWLCAVLFVRVKCLPFGALGTAAAIRSCELAPLARRVLLFLALSKVSILECPNKENRCALAAWAPLARWAPCLWGGFLCGAPFSLGSLPVGAPTLFGCLACGVAYFVAYFVAVGYLAPAGASKHAIPLPLLSPLLPRQV